MAAEKQTTPEKTEKQGYSLLSYLNPFTYSWKKAASENKKENVTVAEVKKEEVKNPEEIKAEWGEEVAKMEETPKPSRQEFDELTKAIGKMTGNKPEAKKDLQVAKIDAKKEMGNIDIGMKNKKEIVNNNLETKLKLGLNVAKLTIQAIRNPENFVKTLMEKKDFELAKNNLGSFFAERQPQHQTHTSKKPVIKELTAEVKAIESTPDSANQNDIQQEDAPIRMLKKRKKGKRGETLETFTFASHVGDHTSGRRR